jgi:hypothetical protein
MDGFQSCSEFGIVTAPKDQEIPDSVYDLPELQNNADIGARSSKRRKLVCDTMFVISGISNCANPALIRTSP